jgi:ArsR family transcriptional regulator, arsenate/arsenite/antimonite-responsive transcriptional repressor
LQRLACSVYICNSGYMDNESAILALAALAQSTRLDTFRLLVSHEPQGLPAGDVAAALDIPQNTMSTHLAVLTRAGLARSERQGRSIIYRADLACLSSLTLFLVKDCCGGSTNLCKPLLAELASCAPSTKVKS